MSIHHVTLLAVLLREDYPSVVSVGLVSNMCRALKETQEAIRAMEDKKAEIETKAAQLEQTVAAFATKSEATEAELIERQVPATPFHACLLRSVRR